MPRPITSSRNRANCQGFYSSLRTGSHGHRTAWRPYGTLTPSAAAVALRPDSCLTDTRGMGTHSEGMDVWKNEV